MQSVPITTNVMSSNPAHGEVHSIQHYVVKIFSDFDRSVVFSGLDNYAVCFAVQAQLNNNPRVNISLHIILIPRQPVIALSP
jgi:hypothetical protein